jgi:NADPH:quinone reductase-like Zn-dependent oxidoreductase
MSTSVHHREETTMKAWARERYGSPDVLDLREVTAPAPADDAVLVRVRATSVNPADWYGVSGTPFVARLANGLRRPKEPLLGVDFSGVAEAVGSAVEGIEPGDEVFGGRTGAFAEQVAAVKAVARKPASISHEEAAGIGIAATTALQSLRDHGRLEAGQKVLVNGASGGVGTYAVQIAKALGAEVTAVCSTDKVELARELGADRVIDYTREDFTRCGIRHDLLLDIGGGRGFRELRRVLAPGAPVVVVGSGGTKPGALGPLGHIARMRLGAIGSGHRCTFFVAKLNRADLEVLAAMIESGQVRTVIDRTYPFEQLPDALRYLGEGHARGKIVVTA